MLFSLVLAAQGVLHAALASSPHSINRQQKGEGKHKQIICYLTCANEGVALANDCSISVFPLLHSVIHFAALASVCDSHYLIESTH